MGVGIMTDKKITELTATTTIASTDLIPVVTNPGTTPETKKITLANLVVAIPTSLNVVTSTQYSRIGLTNGTNTVFQVFGSSVTNDNPYLQLLSGGVGKVQFATNDNSYVMGNFGVGTNAPNGKVEINRTENDDGVILRIGNSTGTAFDFKRIASDGRLEIQGNQANYNNICIAPSSGNVAIGSSNPGTAKLHVTGDIYTTANMSALSITDRP